MIVQGLFNIPADPNPNMVYFISKLDKYGDTTLTIEFSIALKKDIAVLFNT